MNPLDYAFRTLDCSLRAMSPTEDLNEYQLIMKYMNSTSKSKFELKHLFAVNRADEEKRFHPYENSSDRKLLWHGSRVGNFMGILKQGLRVTPRTSTANVSRYWLFQEYFLSVFCLIIGRFIGQWCLLCRHFF